jgi:hypothetical protein
MAKRLPQAAAADNRRFVPEDRADMSPSGRYAMDDVRRRNKALLQRCDDPATAGCITKM